MANLKSVLSEKFGNHRILFDEPMKNHTSFKIGGMADILVLPENIEEIQFVIQKCNEFNTNYYVMGNGSNLLVLDNGFRGVIIKISKAFSNIKVDENFITVESGALLSRVSNEALKNELTGIEFASGIPGNIGGAICMNAGAYGGEIKDIVKSVKVLANNEIKVLSNAECEFEYRNSKILKEKMVVLEVIFELKKGNKEEILSTMNDLKAKRNAKQPVEMPSAGSTFKRPEGYFAGKLIEDAGLRGFSVGGAQISEKHCGFVVNKGNATADDVLKLCEKVSDIVFQKFGVKLEHEIRIIGE